VHGQRHKHGLVTGRGVHTTLPNPKDSAGRQRGDTGTPTPRNTPSHEGAGVTMTAVSKRQSRLRPSPTLRPRGARTSRAGGGRTAHRGHRSIWPVPAAALPPRLKSHHFPRHPASSLGSCSQGTQSGQGWDTWGFSRLRRGDQVWRFLKGRQCFGQRVRPKIRAPHWTVLTHSILIG
jgi:hypothetical protein